MAEENSIKMKREPTVWKNIFANDTSDKGWISKNIKNSQDSTPGRQTTQLKNGQRTRTDTSLEKCHTEGTKIYESMLSITSHQRDEN